jgi:hypothetical protein
VLSCVGDHTVFGDFVCDQIQNMQNTMYNLPQFVQFFHSCLTATAASIDANTVA